MTMAVEPKENAGHGATVEMDGAIRLLQGNVPMLENATQAQHVLVDALLTV
jgi:hypothetical protein